MLELIHLTFERPIIHTFQPTNLIRINQQDWFYRLPDGIRHPMLRKNTEKEAMTPTSDAMP
jgi:hypothetical protein